MKQSQLKPDGNFLHLKNDFYTIILVVHYTL